jgi:hypothetical protein
MVITITHKGKKYSVKVTEWTKRPKANGIYVTVSNNVPDDFLDEIINAVNVNLNLSVHHYFNDKKSRGFVIREDEAKYLSVEMVCWAIKEQVK